MSAATRALRRALALRAWLAHALDDAPLGAPPTDDAAAWRLVLAAEACALAAAQRLDAAGVVLPDAADAVLRAAAARELRRALSAHAQLRRLAAIARDRSLPIVVLKGGAALADGAPLQLLDLDVLPAPGRARELADALATHGYAAHDTDTAGHHHLAPRVAPGDIRVEIHESVLGMDDAAALHARATPLARYAPLLRLRPDDHLWHVAYHASMQHPERRGRLRDRLLLAHARTTCDAATRDAVDARAVASSLGAALADTLDPSRHASAFGAAVGARLAIARRFPDHRARRYLGPVVDDALSLVSTDRRWLAELRARCLAERLQPSELAAVRRLATRAPRAGAAVRLALILVRAAATAAVAAYGTRVAAAARRPNGRQPNAPA